MDTPLLSSAAHETAEYSHSSSISEASSLSDSDWLDISSSRESDDNDSVSSRDFDAGPRRTLSRRSSTSNGSSRGGDVEAWEGLVDDSADEGFLEDHVASIVPFAIHGATESATTQRAMGLTPVVQRDPIDEQRVLDELDQSMTSTLSSSHSSSLGGTHSSTVHSTRDLRLSFPDPLTSSRDELHRSFDDFSPSETNFSSTDVEDTATIPLPSLDVDPDPPVPSPTIDVPCANNPEEGATSTDPDFDIVLYGCSPDIKWSFVFELLQMAERLPILSRITPKIISHTAQHQHIVATDREHSPFSNGVDIIDNTDPTAQDVIRSSYVSKSILTPLRQSYSKSSGERPSLGIVYLPCPSFILPKHTLYLPVFPSRMRGVHCSHAINSWRALRIPNSKVLPLRRDSFLFIVADELHETNDIDAYDAFLALRDEHQRVPSTTGEKVATAASQLTVIAALACLAICTITAVVRTYYSTPAVTPTSEVRSQWAWNPALTPNRSHDVHPETATAAIAPLSLKDLALAVFHPPSTNPNPSRAVVGSESSPQPSCDQCKMMTWSERIQSSKDLILRDVQSFDIEAHSKTARSKARSAHSKALSLIAPAHKKAEALSSSLSIKLADSLSEIVDMKALTEIFRGDLKELVDAIDELMQVVGRQTSAIMAQSKGTVQILRERLQHRHGRAQLRARQLKAMGEQLLAVAEEKMKTRACMTSFREMFKGRGDIAREKARKVKLHFMSSKWKRMEDIKLGREKRERLKSMRHRKKVSKKSKKTCGFR